MSLVACFCDRRLEPGHVATLALSRPGDCQPGECKGHPSEGGTGYCVYEVRCPDEVVDDA